MAYMLVAISSFPRVVLATSVLDFTFLPVAQFARGFTFQLLPLLLLKPALPERFPHRVPVGPDLSPSSCFSHRWGPKLREWSMLLHLRLLLRCKRQLSFRRRPIPPYCPDIHSSKPDGRSGYSLHELQPGGFPEDPAGCPLASKT
jgi:hypothetical protein